MISRRARDYRGRRGDSRPSTGERERLEEEEAAEADREIGTEVRILGAGRAAGRANQASGGHHRRDVATRQRGQKEDKMRRGTDAGGGLDTIWKIPKNGTNIDSGVTQMKYRNQL